MEQLQTLPRIIPNTRVPPRPRSRCVAVSPRRGEQRALGRRLRRGQQFIAMEIYNKRMNAISLARVIAVSLDGISQALIVGKHRQGIKR